MNSTHCSYLILLGGAQEEKYMVVEVRDDAVQQSTHVIEDIEFSRALFELYEGGVVCVYPPLDIKFSLNNCSLCTRAIHLSYISDSAVKVVSLIGHDQVKEVSHDNKVAKVVRTDVNYITSPR